MSGTGYYRDIPSITRRAPTLPLDYPPMSPVSSPRLPSGSPKALGIPSAPRSNGSNASSTDSFVEEAFVQFSDHAFNCDRCYDPLRTHLEGGRLCKIGRHLAAAVKLTLRDETRALKKHRRTHSDEAYIRIPKGCEPVEQLLVAMQKGLTVNTNSDVPTSPRLHNASHFLPSPPTSPRMPSGSTHRSHRREHSDSTSYDDVYYVPARRGGHSDEEIHSSRRSRRHSISEHDGHRMRRSHSTGPRDSSAFLGVEERSRRPYGLSSPRTSADKVSVDSGYDSRGGSASPDHIRRGSQYAEDMRRRHGITIQPTKSALKKPNTYDMPPSPSKLKGVGFNLDGKYKVPGYD